MKVLNIVFLFLLFSSCIIIAEESLFLDGSFTSYEDSEDSKGFDLTGKVRLEANYSIEHDDLVKTDVDAEPKVDMLFKWSGDDVEAQVKFKYSQGIENLKNYVDEAFIRYYGNSYDLEVGLLKPIWGTGDGVHVLDVLNPLDRVENLTGTYLDSKISQMMLKFNYQVGQNGLIELVYVPLFAGDRFPTDSSDKWTPNEVKEAMIILNNSDHGVTIKEDKTDSLKYSQFGSRYTTTFGSLDLGAIYYYGYLREPIYDFTGMNAIQVETGLGVVKEKFNRVQIFGIDFALAISSLYLRGEAAYYLTEDIKGDDSDVYNNSFKYLFGFDYDLPINNSKIIVQCVGSYVINSDEISKSDIEYDDDEYLKNMVTVELSDHYINETLTAKISGAVNIENRDFMISPTLEYTLVDNLDIGFKYQCFEGKDESVFGQFDKNDYLKLFAEYTF